jgi:DNA-binding CsgD family transcriptional regulator
MLAEARELFLAGEFRSSSDLGLAAAELAFDADRIDLAADAALIPAGVPDPSTAAAVESLCRRVLSRSTGVDPSRVAQLHGQLAIALHLRGQLDEADVHVGLADALAQDSGDPRAHAVALHARQLAIAGLGRPSELLALSSEMLDVAAAIPSVDAELWARGWRCDAFLRQGDPGSAGHEVDSLDVLAARSGNCLVRWNALLARAGLDHAVGRFASAEELAQQARHGLPASQRRMTEPLFVAQSMLIATDRGVEPAEIEVARQTAIGAPLIALAMTGRYDLEMGDEDRARMFYAAVLPRTQEISMDRRGLPTLTATLELAVHFADVAVAADLRDRLLPYEGLMIASSLGAVGPVGYFVALVGVLLGELDASIARYEAATALMSSAGFGPWLVRTRLAHAEALLARAGPGDRELARDRAALALSGADQLGMRRVRARVQTVLDGLSGATRLTPREREIAVLVSAGSTNRDICKALVLSERTIETHVQNILTKLGFHSRTQIASWVLREGIAGR